MNHLNKKALTTSIAKCIENGNALVGDADLLLGWDRFSTALALAVLAQEEFAKAFLLQLVAEEALPWVPEVRRSINRHECKHLLAIVMEWLPILDFGGTNDWLSGFNERSVRRRQLIADYEAGRITGTVFLAQIEEEKRAVGFPETVAAALNIYRHEKIESLGNRDPWRDEEWAKGAARKIADGALDEKKQSACFVGIGKTGAVTRHPGIITKAEADQEIKRAKALAEARVTWSDEFYLLKDALTKVFVDLKDGEVIS